jgi:hypothetical protein
VAPPPSDLPLLWTCRRTLARALARLALWAMIAGAVVWLVDRELYRGTPQTIGDLRMRDFERARATTEIAILGTSHMYFGVEPKEVGPHAFNLAGPSQDPYYDAQLVDRYLIGAPHLKAVIWGVSPFTFGYDLGNVRGEERRRLLYDRWFTRRGACDLACVLQRCLEMLRVRGDDPIGAFVRAVTHDTAGLRATTPDGDGFVRSKVEAETDNGAARAKLHQDVYRDALIEPNFELMLHAIRRLRARGVRVILVEPPFQEDYLAAWSPARLDTYAARVQRLVDEGGAEYHDFRAMLPSGQGFFRDADHLQHRGAVYFSRALGQLVR